MAQFDPPPPAYADVTNTECTYVDFIPRCLEGRGIFGGAADYEKFDVLFGRANDWLRNHPQWKVISCESIESKLKYEGTGTADTSKSSYTVDRKRRTYYNRSLRMWICNKTPADSPEPQQIRYVNFVPKCISTGGWGKPEFESFSETIARLNQEISKAPIQGRIINMETQNMKFSTWSASVSPDSCSWQESGEHRVYFLMVLRIFLEVGQGFVNRVGTVNFVPAGSSSSYEPFGAVMTKVNSWIARQPANLNICNVQSIDYKLSSGWSGGDLDTNRSVYTEHGDRKTRFVRMIRLYWTQGSDNDSVPRQELLQITYRTFMPPCLESGAFGLGRYETQMQSAKRMLAWIRATGAKVMSCETIKVRALDYHQNGNPEVTYASDSGTYDKHFIMGLRLYLDGVYRDPPPGVLPPRPQAVQDDDCCTIL